MEGRQELIRAGELIDVKARINELTMLKINFLTILKYDETFINTIIFESGDKYEQGKMDGLLRVVKEIELQINILNKSL